MKATFSAIQGEKPSVIAGLLRESYAALLAQDPRWEAERTAWDQYDGEVFANPGTVGACLFLTRVDGRVAGFASWDPRPAPEYGIIGHNCILPEFRGMGLGRVQIEEVLRRFHALGMKKAHVTTSDHPFFLAAQGMYRACGFHERRRLPWDRDPGVTLIMYEKELA